MVSVTFSTEYRYKNITSDSDNRM